LTVRVIHKKFFVIDVGNFREGITKCSICCADIISVNLLYTPIWCR